MVLGFAFAGARWRLSLKVGGDFSRWFLVPSRNHEFMRVLHDFYMKQYTIQEVGWCLYVLILERQHRVITNIFLNLA